MNAATMPARRPSCGWTFDAVRSALKLSRAGAPSEMIGLMLKIDPARVEALLPETQSPVAAGCSPAAVERVDAVFLRSRASTQLFCISCGKYPARRDADYCSYCLYAP